MAQSQGRVSTVGILAHHEDGVTLCRRFLLRFLFFTQLSNSSAEKDAALRCCWPAGCCRAR